MTDNSILVGGSGAKKTLKEEVLFLPMANRHGLVAGATGTGKTVTLQILAEGFSAMGVPVFAADIKGDLSGISQAGAPSDALVARAAQIGLTDYGFNATPTIFWDLFGKEGHPIRTTISEMGPVLLSRLMGLTDAQEGALNIAFRIADEEGLLLLDLQDLRALLSDLAGRGRSITTDYGNVGAQTIGAIQRRLVVLEEQGAENFFGEPALDINDLMRTTRDGRGYVNIFVADKLMAAPQLYATFLLWLMSELFEVLPEVGDPDKPKLVFFFDEAHLLFADAPPGLLQKIEQVVRLIRSKGVGVYFVTQNPLDVPPTVLAQLGNKVQHALRAFTPRDQKAVKAAATTFRQNPAFSTEAAITELAKGEALVSVLDLKGVPTMVERTIIRPPLGRMGPLSEEERLQLIKQSPVYGIYDTPVNRESAFEKLAVKAKARNAEIAAADADKQAAKDAAQQARLDRAGGSERETASERFVKNVAGSVGRQVGNMVVRNISNALMRGILGSLSRR